MFEFLRKNRIKYCCLTINNKIRAKYYPVDYSDFNTKFPGNMFSEMPTAISAKHTDNFSSKGCYHLQIRCCLFFWVTLRVYPSLEGLLASHAWNYLTQNRRSSRRNSRSSQQTFDPVAAYQDENLPQDYSES